MKLSLNLSWLWMFFRFTSAKFEEPKTPSPRHTNPRKKQKRDVPSFTHEVFASEDQNSNFRNSSGIECLRWQNRKPFRRAAKKRIELRSLSSFLCIRNNNLWAFMVDSHWSLNWLNWFLSSFIHYIWGNFHFTFIINGSHLSACQILTIRTCSFILSFQLSIRYSYFEE